MQLTWNFRGVHLSAKLNYSGIQGLIYFAWSAKHMKWFWAWFADQADGVETPTSFYYTSRSNWGLHSSMMPVFLGQKHFFVRSQAEAGCSYFRSSTFSLSLNVQHRPRYATRRVVPEHLGCDSFTKRTWSTKNVHMRFQRAQRRTPTRSFHRDNILMSRAPYLMRQSGSIRFEKSILPGAFWQLSSSPCWGIWATLFCY